MNGKQLRDALNSLSDIELEALKVVVSKGFMGCDDASHVNIRKLVTTGENPSTEREFLVIDTDAYLNAQQLYPPVRVEDVPHG